MILCKKKRNRGFTLVELLAVIVISVPKVMSIIDDSKKATLESTVKMIASAVEDSCSLVTLTVNADGGKLNKTYEEKTTTNMIQKISPIFAVNSLISKEI